MIALTVLDVALAFLSIGLALWAVTARDAYAAVVGFVAYGLLVGIAWVSLRAVDVALTEIAIGSGLTGALLLGAAARLRRGGTAAADARSPGGTSTSRRSSPGSR